jgi:hypothetical protein
MAVMIKLRLSDKGNDLESVRALPGLDGVRLDERYGVVPINPRESLYVVRTDEIDDLDRRQELSPEILGAYGDIRISTTKREGQS